MKLSLMIWVTCLSRRFVSHSHFTSRGWLTAEGIRVTLGLLPVPVITFSFSLPGLHSLLAFSIHPKRRKVVFEIVRSYANKRKFRL